MEPKYFKYMNKNVYELDDLIKYDQLYFHGCLINPEDEMGR